MSVITRRYAQDDQSYSSNSRATGLPTTVRPQRSMFDIASSRALATGKGYMNDLQKMTGSAMEQAQEYYNRETTSRSNSTSQSYGRTSKSSTSSASSQASSSFFSRKGSYDSATSYNDHESTPKSSRRLDRAATSAQRQRPSRFTADDGETRSGDGNPSTLWESIRPSRLRQNTMDEEFDRSKDNNDPNVEGYGAFVWNKISATANQLSVNVSKAWETGIILEDGESM